MSFVWCHTLWSSNRDYSCRQSGLQCPVFGIAMPGNRDCYVRQKVERENEAPLIQTVRGFGYRLEP